MHLPALSFLPSSISPPTSLLMEQESTEMAHISFPVSGAVALTACTAMSVLYVAILYSPTLILRLPAPASLQEFMIRRFICAIVSSIVSVFLSALLIPVISLSPFSLLMIILCKKIFLPSLWFCALCACICNFVSTKLGFRVLILYVCIDLYVAPWAFVPGFHSVIPWTLSKLFYFSPKKKHL